MRELVVDEVKLMRSPVKRGSQTRVVALFGLRERLDLLVSLAHLQLVAAAADAGQIGLELATVRRPVAGITQ